jgi:putative oxidoreductase
MTLAITLIIVGRVVLGAFFVIAGVRNFLHFGERKSPETNYGWNLPMPVTALGFAVQIVGGLSVLLGIWPAWGAAVLILFLIGATELFHNFLMFNGAARDPHLYLTLVNITLAGFLLTIIGLAL